jgi:hypothetical protein
MVKMIRIPRNLKILRGAGRSFTVPMGPMRTTVFLE